MRGVLKAILLCWLAICPALLFAQGFPTKPVRIVDGFPAGGGTDVLARILAPLLSAGLGQPVVVENRTGAGSNIGADFVAKSAPDGYTLFVGSSTSLTASVTLYKSLPYQLLKDLAPVSTLGYGAFVLTSHPSVPAQSLKEFLDLARTKPGRMNYGSAGLGSGTQLCVELLKQRAGVDLVHIAYKGGAPLQTAAIAGEIELSCVTLTAALPQIGAGRLKALAVTGPSRSAALPQVPTVAEAGFPEAEIVSTFGLYAPASTPKNVIALLNAEVRKVLEVPSVRERYAAQGVQASGSTPEEFGAVVSAEVAKWAAVIKAANIRIE